MTFYAPQFFLFEKGMMLLIKFSGGLIIPCFDNFMYQIKIRWSFDSFGKDPLLGLLEDRIPRHKFPLEAI